VGEDEEMGNNDVVSIPRKFARGLLVGSWPGRRKMEVEGEGLAVCASMMREG
jgi:hypothetical protein